MQLIGHPSRFGVIHLHRDGLCRRAQIRPDSLVRSVAIERELDTVARKNFGAGEKRYGRRKFRLGCANRHAIRTNASHAPDGGAARDEQDSDHGPREE